MSEIRLDKLQAEVITANHNINPNAHNDLISAKRPNGFTWDFEAWPILPSYSLGDIRIGSAGISPEDLFDSVSVARDNPGATFYVNISTGLDTNNGLSSGTAVKSLWKAIGLANTSGVPSKIIVAPGIYPRANNFGGGSSAIVDIALIADGGTVICGTFDQYATPSLDGTYTNTYSWSVQNIARVVDIQNRTPLGGYTELVPVSSAAICNETPGSWYADESKVYIRRLDSSAVNYLNTRVYRRVTHNLAIGKRISVFIGGTNSNSRWSFEGGLLGAISYSSSDALLGNKQALVVKNANMLYPGNYVDATTARCVQVDSMDGIAAFFNVNCIGGMTDGFNYHNDLNTSAIFHSLHVNCSGSDMGRINNESCNILTLHENVYGIDICGDYCLSRGGVIRNIGTSQLWAIGTKAKDDMGDGIITPTSIMIDDTAKLWAESVKCSQSANGFAWYCAQNANIYLKASLYGRNDGGSGIISEY